MLNNHLSNFIYICSREKNFTKDTTYMRYNIFAIAMLLLSVFITTNASARSLNAPRLMQDFVQLVQKTASSALMHADYGDDGNSGGGYYGSGGYGSNGYGGSNYGGSNNGDDDGSSGGYNGGSGCNNNEIPLDGGLSFLALAGIGLGIKKVRDNRNRSKE